MTASLRRRSVTLVGAAGGHDAPLLARIQAGDEQALSAVYDEHAGLVFGLARRVTCDEQLARDITQEVFAYLWELPGRVDLARGSLQFVPGGGRTPAGGGRGTPTRAAIPH